LSRRSQGLPIVLARPGSRDQRHAAGQALIHGVVAGAADHQVNSREQVHSWPIAEPGLGWTTRRATRRHRANGNALERRTEGLRQAPVPGLFVTVARGANQHALRLRDAQQAPCGFSRRQLMGGSNQPRRSRSDLRQTGQGRRLSRTGPDHQVVVGAHKLVERFPADVLGIQVAMDQDPQRAPSRQERRQLPAQTARERVHDQAGCFGGLDVADGLLARMCRGQRGIERQDIQLRQPRAHLIRIGTVGKDADRAASNPGQRRRPRQVAPPAAQRIDQPRTRGAPAHGQLSVMSPSNSSCGFTSVSPSASVKSSGWPDAPTVPGQSAGS